MEIQLQELIDQIKNDGVAAAETEAASILCDAKAQAEKIISEAKSKAEKIMLEAKSENERTVKVSEDAIRQAGRNLLISFRESVNRELDTIIGDTVKNAYSSDSMSELIIKVVEAWAKDADFEDISVILNSKDLTLLEEGLLAALKEKMLKGITLKPNDNFDGGFRIEVSNGKAYYDYSSEAVVEMLSTYLSPKVTSLMKEAN